ncbi:MAG: hypothetical protein B6U89_02415 [Desulfurococcales archaeon ex4484_58]|nr:MAG: hypothetical protein B6U89_02415 [Desulfurococcales archaeon ex4484_58]
MLRLKIRIERIDSIKNIETIGLANSGFIGQEPEILLPRYIIEELDLDSIVKPEKYYKITGDGRRIELLRYRDGVKVYVITEDRVVDPVKANVLTIEGSRYVLLNDKLLGELGIVLIDFGRGIWCFRDELGKKTRLTY